jgi:hypothetical protein
VTPETDTRLSLHVVEAVAESEGVDPTDLSYPLDDAVDTDALDVLFRPTPSGEPRSGTVSFEYHGYAVFVSSDGTVRLDATEDEGC